MTTTTPESRARIAYTAYLRGKHRSPGATISLIPPDAPTFDGLPAAERDGWMKAADVLWSLATTGTATL